MPYETWLQRVAPSWFQGEAGEKWWGAVGRFFDDYVSRVKQAAKADAPSLGAADGLDDIGDDRLLPRGPSESEASYRARLKDAFDKWALAGAHKGLLLELKAMGFPMGTDGAHIVQYNGRYTYLDSNDDLVVGNLMNCVNRPDLTGAINPQPGWVFDAPDTLWSKFGILFPKEYEPAVKAWQVDADGGPAYVDETTDFNSATSADVLPFPASEAVGDYFAVGLATKFGKLKLDNAGGTAGVGGTVAWEYWNGSAWTALSGVTDGTTGFTAAAADGQVVSWTMPADWATTSINGSAQLYYVRARVTQVYTTNPVYDQGFVGGMVAALAITGGAPSDELALLHFLAKLWAPSKAVFDGTYVIVAGQTLGWPTGRTMGTDPNLGGNSVRVLPA